MRLSEKSVFELSIRQSLNLLYASFVDMWSTCKHGKPHFGTSIARAELHSHGIEHWPYLDCFAVIPALIRLIGFRQVFSFVDVRLIRGEARELGILRVRRHTSRIGSDRLELWFPIRCVSVNDHGCSRATVGTVSRQFLCLCLLSFLKERRSKIFSAGGFRTTRGVVFPCWGNSAQEIVCCECSIRVQAHWIQRRG